jgi:hypothetical protein
MKAATTQMSANAALFISVFFTFGPEVRFTEDTDFPKQSLIRGKFFPIDVNHTIGVWF